VAISLPPPPPANDLRGPAWQDWFFKLRNYISSILTTINTSGILGPFTNHAVIVADGTNTITSLGSLGTTTQVLHGNAAGDPTWGAVDLANDVAGNLAVTHLNSGTGASSSTYWRGDETWATPTGISLGPFTIDAVIVASTTSDITSLSSLGTSTQVLHGNATGVPTWGAVDLANDVSGNLAVTHLNSGTGASSSTYWRGDETWATPTGGGGPQPNMAHNSEFRYYIPGVHGTVTFDSSDVTFSEHAPRWYGWADRDGFESSILDPIGIRLEKVNFARNTAITMYQIFDNDDSVKFRGKDVTVSVVIKKGTGNTSLNTCKLGFTMGEGTNETLFTHFDVGWTNETNFWGSELAGSITDSYQVFSETWTLDPTTTQLLIYIGVQWDADEFDVNPYVDIQGIYMVEGATARDIDTKSMAVVQHECCRYKRVSDLYLRDSYESHLIDMRDVPTVDVGVTCTTTGTTKDTLIIKTDSSSDNGVHTVTLDAELL